MEGPRETWLSAVGPGRRGSMQQQDATAGWHAGTARPRTAPPLPTRCPWMLQGPVHRPGDAAPRAHFAKRAEQAAYRPATRCPSCPPCPQPPASCPSSVMQRCASALKSVPRCRSWTSWLTGSWRQSAWATTGSTAGQTQCGRGRGRGWRGEGHAAAASAAAAAAAAAAVECSVLSPSPHLQLIPVLKQPWSTAAPLHCMCPSLPTPQPAARRYGVSKLCEATLTRILARRLAPRCICVEAMCPGAHSVSGTVCARQTCGHSSGSAPVQTGPPPQSAHVSPFSPPACRLVLHEHVFLQGPPQRGGGRRHSGVACHRGAADARGGALLEGSGAGRLLKGQAFSSHVPSACLQPLQASQRGLRAGSAAAAVPFCLRVTAC